MSFKQNILLAIAIVISGNIYSQKAITPAQAKDHIGETVTVCGKIYGGKFFEGSKSQPTLLDMGAAFPNSPLTILIAQADRKNFTYKPEDFFTNKDVCITGKVIDYNGKPEIIISRPDGIAIREGSAGGGSSFKPLDIAPLSKYAIDDWREE